MTMRSDIAPIIDSLAHARAVMFAALPPETSTPDAVAGMPSQERNHPRTVSSTWVGPAPSIHDPA